MVTLPFNEKLQVFFKKNFDRNETLKYEKQLPHWRRVVQILLSIIVRLVFVTQSIFLIYYVSGLESNTTYFVELPLVIIIIVDLLYVSIFRDGKEYTWLVYKIQFQIN